MATTAPAGGGHRHVAVGHHRSPRHVAVPRSGSPHAASRTRPARAVARLTARLLRRGTVAMMLGVALYMAVEAVSFTVGYPDAASRAALVAWGQDPTIRILAGPATAVDTLGGFAVWDSGLILSLVVCAWAVTTTTRVLRGDEAAGRSELVLAGAVPAGRALLAQVGVLLAACVGVGAAVGAALAAGGAQGEGALAYGAAVAALAATTVAVATVTAQLLVSRAGASGAAASVVVVAVLLRVVANSAESRSWLAWLTPLGWTDQLRPFGENRWGVLLVPLAVTTALVGGALAVRARRDLGAGALSRRGVPRSRRWGLRGPAGFAWRSGLGTLLGWTAGTALSAGVVGAMVPTIEEFLAEDAGFQDILVAIGMDTSDLVRGFFGMTGTLIALAISVQVAFRLGAARTEEASGRAELLLARPLLRRRWLAGHVLGAAAAALLLAGAAAAATWAGAAVAGADVAASDAVLAMFGPLPAVAVLAGTGVLVLGVAPRLTVVVAASAPPVAYVLELVGPLLDWPEAVVGLSPFHHLAAVPVEPFATAPALVMIAVGIALATAGVWAFGRRDLAGA